MFITSIPFKVMSNHILLIIGILRLIFIVISILILSCWWYLHKNNANKSHHPSIMIPAFGVLITDLLFIISSDILISSDFHSKSFQFTDTYCNVMNILSHLIFTINHYLFYLFLLNRVKIAFKEPLEMKISSTTNRLCQMLIYILMVQYFGLLFVINANASGI